MLKKSPFVYPEIIDAFFGLRAAHENKDCHDETHGARKG